MTTRPADRLRIRATDWNAINRAARRVNQTGVDLGGQSPSLLATSPTTALARNTGDEAIPRWGAVLCSGPVVLPDDNEAEWGMRLALDVAIPTAVDQWSWAAVATTPIAAGKFGRVCVSGAVQSIVVVLDEDHRFAELADDEQYLQSAVAGPCRILWKEDGTGEKRAIVAVNGGVMGGAVVSGTIASVTEDEDPATLGFQGYIVATHQNAATDLLAAVGTTIPCVNSLELATDLQAQVQDESPGAKTLLRLPVGTPVGPIVRLPVPTETGELWMFTTPNAYGVDCP